MRNLTLPHYPVKCYFFTSRKHQRGRGARDQFELEINYENFDTKAESNQTEMDFATPRSD